VRVRIGRVGRPHGIDGSFVVVDASDDARWWRVGSRFLVDGEPVEVVGARRSSGRPVVRVDRPVERGAALEVERSQLPPTDQDEYYAFELAGLEVVEESGRVLGTVKAVNPGVANDALELDSGLLLPMIEDCVLDVDLAARRIRVAEGFAGAA
jgi:16S rRNA processing protein RimM